VSIYRAIQHPRSTTTHGRLHGLTP